MRGGAPRAERRDGSRKVGGRVGSHHVRGGDARVLEHQVHEFVVELADDHAEANGGVGLVPDVVDRRGLPLVRVLALVREDDDVVRLLDASGGVVLVLLGQLRLLVLLRGLLGGGDD